MIDKKGQAAVEQIIFIGILITLVMVAGVLFFNIYKSNAEKIEDLTSTKIEFLNFNVYGTSNDFDTKNPNNKIQLLKSSIKEEALNRISFKCNESLNFAKIYDNSTLSKKCGESTINCSKVWVETLEQGQTVYQFIGDLNTNDNSQLGMQGNMSDSCGYDVNNLCMFFDGKLVECTEIRNTFLN